MNVKPDDMVVLIVDDDEDDFLLLRKALQEVRFSARVERVRNGHELLDYLYKRGAYAREDRAPVPALILLDLNMPGKTGLEALREIKGQRHLRRIPILVMTTSDADEDVRQTYRLGANSFIHKPLTYRQLVHVMAGVKDYWLNVVRHPPPPA